MLVAITGASGTVGRRLVERHAAAGDRVRVLSRSDRADAIPAAEIHRGDLTSGGETLARFADGADVLYHCAAEIHEPSRMMAVNAGGTRNLVAAARGRIAHWVQLGSIATYGAPQSGTIDEDTPPAPIDAYGHSKTAADEAALAAAREGAFSCCVLRPSKVFGAGTASGNNEILFRLFKLVDRGVFFYIGEPGAMAHYVHVDNLVDALLRCGRAKSVTRVFNLSDERTLEHFIGVVAAALGRKAPTWRLPERPVRIVARVLGGVPGWPLDERRVDALVNRASFPATRIERELGYAPVVTLEDGLRELVAHWRRER